MRIDVYHHYPESFVFDDFITELKALNATLSKIADSVASDLSAEDATVKTIAQNVSDAQGRIP